MSSGPIQLDLPSTAERPAIQPARSGRQFGVRLWLALIFAAIGILTGTSVYLFVSESSGQAAQDRSQEVADLRTRALSGEVASALGAVPPDARKAEIRRAVKGPLGGVSGDAYQAWYVDAELGLISRPEVENKLFDEVPERDATLDSALDGEPLVVEGLSSERFVVGYPVTRDDEVEGAVLALADRPDEVTEALQALQGERLTALSIAVLVAAIIGFLVASLISTRVKRLAGAAEQIAEGHLDLRVNPSGRDEIGDLGRSLDSMRIALAETFATLSSERDRLSAIFTSLNEAVMVVDAGGDVRFANPAASELIGLDGRPIEDLRPWVRRATHRGSAGSDHEQVGDRVVGISARNLPAENAALLVVRDRTEELRRDEAEREFVSNAAHELRNPIAGMSGAIEVLRSGAKEDPEARDMFLERLAIDVERVSRLTKSLLTLARMEAIGQGEADVVSVALAIDEARAAVKPPEGIELAVEADPELIARADPVLLRQVVIGLLSNAIKHTIAPGIVTLRARRGGTTDDEVVIEVQDTGEGIAEAERDRVFERFYRGSGSLEREGFGLGLAIAKRMVDVMGGEISVRSEEQVGSTFTVRLPMSEQAPTPIA